MSIWIAVLFGVIQGITEFLPVSSSGHLALLGSFLGVFPSSGFVLLLHFATLVAIILFFWREIVYCLTHPFEKQTINLVFATICTALVALSVARFDFASSCVALGPCFIVSGIILIATKLLAKKENISFGTGSAFAVGMVQGLCVLPGLSRLGATTSTLRLCGLDNEKAVSISFLLSLPVVIGGIVLEFAKGSSVLIGTNAVYGVVAFAVAFFVALGAAFVLKIITKKNLFWIFAPYLIVLGVATCIWQYA